MLITSIDRTLFAVKIKYLSCWEHHKIGDRRSVAVCQEAKIGGHAECFFLDFGLEYYSNTLLNMNLKLI